MIWYFAFIMLCLVIGLGIEKNAGPLFFALLAALWWDIGTGMFVYFILMIFTTKEMAVAAGLGAVLGKHIAK